VSKADSDVARGPGREAAGEGRDPVSAIVAATREEPFARKMGMRCVAAEPGFCRVEMTVTKEMANLFAMAHGGAVFSLLEEALQVACNSHGLTATALTISVTFVSGARAGDRLVAEAREVSLTKRTGTYDIRVTREDGDLVALAQALAQRQESTPPFLKG
jgi:acyl-CoA thioesterase